MGVKKETAEEAKAREEKERRDRYGFGGGFGFGQQQPGEPALAVCRCWFRVLLCVHFSG
jgi:hypothetical protein